jgi:UDP-N-acetylglucosamine:LPS N-acetylglucosamine transferase
VKRIAILMSDTGGGHRALANAITAALDLRYPGQVHADFVDMYREYTFYPLTRGPELYALWLQHSLRTYTWYWRSFDFLLRSPLTVWRPLGCLFASGIRHLAAKYQPDLLVVVHGGFGRTTVLGRDYAGLDVPICSVVLDPGRPHRAWFHPNTDRCLVPCRDSYELARETGHPPDRLRLIGYAVHPRFGAYTASQAEARRELGWDENRPALLLQAGGEGVGPLEKITRALDDGALDVQVAVVCGKNEKTAERLRSLRWRRPPRVYGFVRNMEVFLRAADLTVMKAGPTSVHEAAVVGTPMILCDAIPYQEWGVMNQAADSGAAVVCTEPRAIAKTAAELLQPGNPALARMAAGCQAFATPDAVFDVADEIAALVGLREAHAVASACS